MRIKNVLKNTVAILLVLGLLAPLAFAGSTTSTGYYKPAANETGYGAAVNLNFDKNDELASGWAKTGWTINYVSATSFVVTGDKTAFYTTGRRIKAFNGTTPVYSQVVSSSYNGGTGYTTVTIADSVLDVTLTDVEHSIIGTVNGPAPVASSSLPGVVELATDAETITGTDAVRATTPATIAAKMDTDGTLAGNLDTRIATQKATKTYSDTKLAKASNLSDVGVAATAFSNIKQAATISTSGVVTLAPSFMAQISAQQNNVTGDGTMYSLTGAFWTEINDNGNNFSNGTFTAPATGLYQLNVLISLLQLTSNHTNCEVYFSTSNRQLVVFTGNLYAMSTGGAILHSFSMLTDMDAADTAFVKIRCYATDKTIDIDVATIFSGSLVR